MNWIEFGCANLCAPNDLKLILHSTLLWYKTDFGWANHDGAPSKLKLVQNCWSTGYGSSCDEVADCM